jgi:hypothetical protein
MSQSTNKTPNSRGCDNFFGEVIYSYTRAQAIDDGVLIDATELARDAGFKCPVALTATAWADCVAWSDADNERQAYQDQTGRLWDVLFMASYAVRTANNANQQLQFELQRIPRAAHSARWAVNQEPTAHLETCARTWR